MKIFGATRSVAKFCASLCAITGSLMVGNVAQAADRDAAPRNDDARDPILGSQVNLNAAQQERDTIVRELADKLIELERAESLCVQSVGVPPMPANKH